ncbi:hypothetical protein IZ6_07450 [Terrihabitans soli]|uniref:Uncharacterized protein n=1 Tax=Terrihabitans soli TaxID=708113 RepID=A0A6S6QSV1_9HYPH|nr:hypothetical protein [Terrihabitans soli]BCJ90010.1 hypothetical protein IZ6_07450 [Terrihabitans soli]
MNGNIFPTLNGRALDVTALKPEDICFREIAGTLARIFLYQGATDLPVSLAQHYLIGLDACPVELRAEWLLYATPCWATGGLARFGSSTHEMGLRRKVHGVIRAAAGMNPDYRWSDSTKINDIQRLAMRTALRDFNGDRLARGAWPEEVVALDGIRKTYRLRGIEDVASELYVQFRTYLPKCPARS